MGYVIGYVQQEKKSLSNTASGTNNYALLNLSSNMPSIMHFSQHLELTNLNLSFIFFLYWLYVNQASLESGWFQLILYQIRRVINQQFVNEYSWQWVYAVTTHFFIDILQHKNEMSRQ